MEAAQVDAESAKVNPKSAQVDVKTSQVDPNTFWGRVTLKEIVSPRE